MIATVKAVEIPVGFIFMDTLFTAAVIQWTLSGNVNYKMKIAELERMPVSILYICVHRMLGMNCTS